MATVKKNHSKAKTSKPVNKDKLHKNLLECAIIFYTELLSAITCVHNGKLKNNNKYTSYNLISISKLILYCDLIINGQFKKAQAIQQNMDTSVYELIPNSLWEKIESGDF